jgi:pimeloyl-ACP methyl ester carboxylesterase
MHWSQSWTIPAVAVCGGLALSCAQAPIAAATATGAFENGDVRLSYRLDTPAGVPPFPAVVIGHGSGRTLKDVCRWLANPMLRRGYATLCYDKRGVGESTGTYVNVGTSTSEAHFPLLASDMAAGVAFLRAHPRIDRKRVGLIGISQAGWIMPIAAAQSSPAFMILLVGPTVSVGEEMHYSRFAEETQMPVGEAESHLATFTGPRGFDPRPVLESLTVPGLWLLGAEDRSIPTIRTTRILDELIARGRPFVRVVYPGAGHDLRGADFWKDIDAWMQTLR